MATLDSRFTINGLVDTARPALENLEAITNACATWLTYDGLTGEWSVIINQAGNATVQFDDSNIMGGIQLVSTEMDGMYTECEVRFHNQALRDLEDYVLLEIPAGDRLPNETTNRLIINAPFVNNAIQAQLLGLIELKQSRLDWVITFRADYSTISLEAGDIISVTNSSYGWTNEVFRVLKVTETESDGALTVEITAQQYSDSVYDTSDLFEYVRPTETGLIQLDPLRDVSPITDNTAVLDSSGNSLLGLLGANALVALIKKLMEDDSTASDGIFSKIFDIFATDTGTDIRQNIKDGAVYGYDLFAAETAFVAWTANNASTVTDGQSNTINVYSTGNTEYSTSTFTALETAPHAVSSQVVAYYAGADYDITATMFKNANVYVINTAGNTVVSSRGDTIRGDSFQDIPIPLLANLTAGDTYKITYDCEFEQLNGLLSGGHSLNVVVSRSI